MDPRDRKKTNIQAQKSSDGTFEIVVGNLPPESGLHEVSEDEVSFIESVAPPTKQKGPAVSPKVAVIAVAAVALVGAAVWGVTQLVGSNSSEDEVVFAAGELPEVEGFKPYAGSVTRPAKKRKSKLTRKAVKPLAKSDEAEESNKRPKPDLDVAARKPVPVPVPDENVIESDEEKPPGWDSVPDTVAANEIDESNDDSAEIEAASRKAMVRELVPNRRKLPVGKINNNLPKLNVVKGIQELRPQPRIAPETFGDESEY